MPVQANNLGDTISKIPNTKEGRVAQVVEYLPSKCEALSSNPSTLKKNQHFYPTWLESIAFSCGVFPHLQ
jgi:hypothetical protein